MSTASATALFHTLIPDHWLPFVLIGRARGWSGATVARISGLSALVHVGLSLALGLGAVAVGVGAAHALGETLERVAAVLLVVFGLAYACWAWRHRGHFHPGGDRLHGVASGEACSGAEGEANPEHLHYHADSALIRDRGEWSGVSLAVIVGLNPCVLVFPLLVEGASRGPLAMTLVALAYGAPTLLLMVALSVLGVRSTRRLIRLPAIWRHMELVSGLLVAALGAVYFVWGH